MEAHQSLTFRFDPCQTPVEASERSARLVDPGFGRVFTDHMALIRYSDDKGWHDAQITARVPLSVDPAASVLHYAQEIFEGMKAYRLADGGTALFRPEANARRFQDSARRMAMPELPERLFLESVERLALEPDLSAWAMIKSVAIGPGAVRPSELPRPRRWPASDNEGP